MMAIRMRLRIEASRCQGHNRCRALIPQLCGTDDLGQGVVFGEGIVRPEWRADAELAVRNCPEFALILESEPTA
jgi:ferredoxin